MSSIKMWLFRHASLLILMFAQHLFDLYIIERFLLANMYLSVVMLKYPLCANWPQIGLVLALSHLARVSSINANQQYVHKYCKISWS